MPMVTLSELSLCIESKVILQSISLDIRAGEYISIIGPNGAGKTSLLKCLMRIHAHYRGSIRISGRPTDTLAPRDLARQISYVPQSTEGPFPFSVYEFVMMGRYPYFSAFAPYSAQDRRAVDEALELTGMCGLCHRRLDTLSGGERQIAFIAAAVAQGAGIMVLDEPVTFLDPKHVQEIQNILQTLNRQKSTTIITTTHDLNSAALHSHRVVILKQGALIFADKPQNMMNNHVLSEAFEKQFIFMAHPETSQTIIAPEVARGKA